MTPYSGSGTGYRAVVGLNEPGRMEALRWMASSLLRDTAGHVRNCDLPKNGERLAKSRGTAHVREGRARDV